MEIFMALLMSIAVNLDNFYDRDPPWAGSKNPSRSFPTWSSQHLPDCLQEFFPVSRAYSRLWPSTAANAAGALMILAFGVCCLCSRDTGDGRLPGLSPKGACLLGISLAANCIPPAIGAGISGIFSPRHGFILRNMFLCVPAQWQPGRHTAQEQRHFPAPEKIYLLCF